MLSSLFAVGIVESVIFLIECPSFPSNWCILWFKILVECTHQTPILTAIKPELLNKKDGIKYDTNVKNIVSCYSQYVNTVCAYFFQSTGWAETSYWEVEFIFSTAPELAGRIRSFSTVSTSKGDSMLPGKNAETQVSYSKRYLWWLLVPFKAVDRSWIMQGSIFRIKNSCCFLHYLKCAEYKLLALVVMKLLLKYDYYI